MVHNDFSSLEGIYNTIKSGHYNLSPVEIGNLTLKLGHMVDKNPTEHSVLTANEILMELLSNASKNNDMIIWEALLHKFEYIASKYDYLMSAELLQSLQNLIAAAKQDFISWLKGLPPKSNVNILRRVEHSTLHYDFDGFLDALSINDNQNFYEIASISVERLINTGVVPSRHVVSEDRPQRANNRDDDNDDNNDGPRGPRYAFASMPPPRPPRPPRSPRQQPKPEKEKMDWRYFDVLDLIVISVLNSLTSGVKPIPGGCQLFLKQEILDKKFEPYEFCYGYYYSEGNPKNDNLRSQQKGQVHIFEAHNWARIANGAYSKSDYMSAQEYACKFLELVGLAPQIGADNIIIVHGDTLIKGFYDFFDLKDLKNAVALLELSYRLDFFRPIRRELLKCTGMDVKPWMKRDLLAYTPAMSSKFWEYETRMNDLMTYINSRNFGQGRV